MRLLRRKIPKAQNAAAPCIQQQFRLAAHKHPSAAVQATLVARAGLPPFLLGDGGEFDKADFPPPTANFQFRVPIVFAATSERLPSGRSTRSYFLVNRAHQQHRCRTDATQAVLSPHAIFPPHHLRVLLRASESTPPNESAPTPDMKPAGEYREPSLLQNYDPHRLKGSVGQAFERCPSKHPM